MGVSGCGKSTVGRAIAESLGGDFIDADNHHPAHNLDLMSMGTPLTDADRFPWLQILQQILYQHRMKYPRRYLILACSALKEEYRSLLVKDNPHTHFVHLYAPFSATRARLMARKGHFVSVDILESQYETLDLHPRVEDLSTRLPAYRHVCMCGNTGRIPVGSTQHSSLAHDDLGELDDVQVEHQDCEDQCHVSTCMYKCGYALGRVCNNICTIDATQSVDVIVTEAVAYINTYKPADTR
eukprot:CFRG6203T1